MSDNKNETATVTLPSEISFHYLKSPSFKSIHADGVIGGLTPRGLLHFAIFSERAAIPKKTTHKVENGVIDQERAKVEGLDGFVRELEVDVFMDFNAAEQLRDWLSRVMESMSKQQVTTENSASKQNGK